MSSIQNSDALSADGTQVCLQIDLQEKSPLLHEEPSRQNFETQVGLEVLRDLTAERAASESTAR